MALLLENPRRRRKARRRKAARKASTPANRVFKGRTYGPDRKRKNFRPVRSHYRRSNPFNVGALMPALQTAALTAAGFWGGAWLTTKIKPRVEFLQRFSFGQVQFGLGALAVVGSQLIPAQLRSYTRPLAAGLLASGLYEMAVYDWRVSPFAGDDDDLLGESPELLGYDDDEVDGMGAEVMLMGGAP